MRRFFEALTATGVGAGGKAECNRPFLSYKEKDCRQVTQVHFLRTKQSYLYFKNDSKCVIWI